MSSDSDFAVITLSQGQIKGNKRQSIYEQSYYSFEGIPYGQPPVGHLRFRAPEPAKSWTGIKDCTHYDGKPTQKNLRTRQIEGTEDCLYLNVYAKTLSSDKQLPVMVYIYGGGFYMGEATRALHGPDYFMHEDIVLVTLNYRLCALGFLSLQDPSLQVPGNAGLKDQVLALRWIKQHISQFNGDANNITLFGESAGAVSTHILALSEQTRGLFHKAILQSGCALNNWGNIPAADFAYRLAKYRGYTGENVDRQVLAYLMTLDASQLVEYDILSAEDKRNGLTYPFAPTVEPYASEHYIILHEPFELMKTAWSNDIPFIVGGTSFEGLLMYPQLKLFPQVMSIIGKDPPRFLPQEIREQNTPEAANQLGEKIIKLHFGDRVPNEESLFDFLDFYSHKSFWHSFHRTILSRLAYASADTYLYRFDFDSPDFNHYRKKFCGKDPVRGVAHADDLSYLFSSNACWKLDNDTAEYRTIQNMIGLWTAFAKNSNPNCKELEPVNWRPLSEDNPNIVLNISNDLSIIELPERAKLDVYDSLYEKENLY